MAGRSIPICLRCGSIGRCSGRSTNIYHPHEVAADLFAKLVLYDTYRSKWLNDSQRAAQEKTFGPLREWFRKNLGNSGKKS